MKKYAPTLRYHAPFLIFVIISLWQLSLSPLFAFTDFSDINTMLSVGKAMWHGVIPFKDLFEQRGLYMYLIHLVGALPNNQGLHLIWLFEIINCYFIYRVLNKIFALKITRKYTPWFSMSALILLTLAPPFNQGASPEEFMLLPITYISYLALRFQHNTQLNLTNKELFLIGLGLGWIVNIKYSNLGTFAMFILWYFCYLLLKHKYDECLRTIKMIALGLLTAFIPILIYFTANQALSAFVHGYFIENTGLLSAKSGNATRVLAAILGNLEELTAMLSVLLIPLICTFTTIRKTARWCLLSMVLAQLLSISLIMRVGTSYGLSVTWMIIILGLYGLPELMHILKTHTFMNLVFSFAITSAILVNGYITHLANTTQTMLGFRITNIRQYQKATNPHGNADIQQSKIIDKHGSGRTLALGYIPNNLYLYNKSYPDFRYFDQTTIPYRMQPQAANAQYHYLKTAQPKWISMQFLGIKSKNTNDYMTKRNKLALTQDSDIVSANVASVSAYAERDRKHVDQYQPVLFKKHHIRALVDIPKPMTKNYYLVDIGISDFISISQKNFRSMNLLFIRKTDLHRYPDLKPVPITP